MKFLFTAFLVVVLLLFIECGLITNLLNSVSKEPSRIHEEIRRVFIIDNRNDSDTERPSSKIINNVLSSIGKDISKAFDNGKSTYQDTYNTVNENVGEKEENQNPIQQNINVLEIQYINATDILEISNPSNKYESNAHVALNDLKMNNSVEINRTGIITTTKDNLEAIERTTVVIEEFPIESTTEDPKTITIKVEITKNSTNYTNIIKSMIDIDKHGSEVLNITTAKPTTLTSKSVIDEVQPHILGNEEKILFPDEYRKLKEIAMDVDKAGGEKNYNGRPHLSQIVFRHSDNTTMPCPSGLVMEKGNCVPERDNFNGGCPSGTQRGDGDTCEELV